MRGLFGVALLCAFLLLSACGSDVPEVEPTAAVDAYRPAFTDAVAGYQERIGAVQEQGQEALSSGSEEAVLDVYGALRDATVASAEDLEALQPPPEVAEQHGELVAALSRQSQALDDVIAAAQGRDDAALTEALTSLAEQLVEVSTIQQSIDTELGASSEPSPAG